MMGKVLEAASSLAFVSQAPLLLTAAPTAHSDFLHDEEDSRTHLDELLLSEAARGLHAMRKHLIYEDYESDYDILPYALPESPANNGGSRSRAEQGLWGSAPSGSKATTTRVDTIDDRRLGGIVKEQKARIVHTFS